jgi:hypothetical protein
MFCQHQANPAAPPAVSQPAALLLVALSKLTSQKKKQRQHGLLLLPGSTHVPASLLTQGSVF